MVQFKIVSTDGRLFGFALDIVDVIKPGIIESTDLGYLMCYSERSVNNRHGASPYWILNRIKYACQAWWYTLCNFTGNIIWDYNGSSVSSSDIKVNMYHVQSLIVVL